MKVLLVKMSSLGDVVHTLPAVHDAVSRGARLDWVVEEDYQPLVALAAGVGEALPVALRRWRRAPLASRREIADFHRRLRRRHYDLVLDAQGLLKSAVVSRWARATERAGLDPASAREGAAALAYERRLRVPRGEHAISRCRRLFAAALGYHLPTTAPAFGLDPGPGREDSVVLAHGTTWNTKLWPEAYWIEVARRAVTAGLTPVLPWVGGERRRAARIAAAAPGAEVCQPTDLAGILALISKSRAVLGVDSGLTHLGAALGRPTVMLFGPTAPRLTGCQGPYADNLAAPPPCSPCLSKRCHYRGPPRWHSTARSRWHSTARSRWHSTARHDTGLPGGGNPGPGLVGTDRPDAPGTSPGTGAPALAQYSALAPAQHVKTPACLAAVTPDRAWSALTALMRRERAQGTPGATELHLAGPAGPTTQLPR